MSSGGGRVKGTGQVESCGVPVMRGWRNTVEIVLLETSNSMNPYPSVFYACASRLRPAISFVEPTNLDEASNRIPPTSQVGAAKSMNALGLAHHGTDTHPGGCCI